MGFGVEVSNVTYSGSLEAIGKFNGSVTTLGIDEGIIMTTGTIADVEAGPHGPNDLTNAGVDNAMPGYPPLSNLFEISTFNASVLEFDFVSISDTVQLEYIFGSEEYPEYINTQFNDVIAFFISGPGINGVRNMALIPNTSLEVNINSINNGQSNSGPCNYCIYYNFNGLSLIHI